MRFTVLFLARVLGTHQVGTIQDNRWTNVCGVRTVRACDNRSGFLEDRGGKVSVAMPYDRNLFA